MKNITSLFVLLLFSYLSPVYGDSNKPQQGNAVNAEIIITHETPEPIRLYSRNKRRFKNIIDHEVVDARSVESIQVVDKGRYYASIRFVGCMKNKDGKCKLKAIYSLIRPDGKPRFSSGWLELWDGKAPTYKVFGFNGFGGRIRGKPPGNWEIVATIKDEIANKMYPISRKFIVPAPDLPVLSKPKSLCKTEESLIFACSHGKKEVSVCSSSNILNSKGHLVYRFGKKNSVPELEYPKKGISPHHAFNYFLSTHPKGGTELIQFNIGSYTYLVFSDRHPFEGDGTGLVVNKGGERISYMQCDEGTIDNNLYQLRYLGLPKGKFIDIAP